MSQSKIQNTGIIILAAGESSRLGQPKQLLLFNKKYLLQHIIDMSISSKAENIVLVLGAFSNDIKSHMDLNGVILINNDNWKNGLASSIICGLNELLKINSELDSVIYVLCDQPFVSSPLLDDIFTKQHETGAEIIRCNYGKAFGPPVLFYKSFFPLLKTLKGNEGAKSLINQYSEKIEDIFFSAGSYDIDTFSDYQNLKDSNQPPLR